MTNANTENIPYEIGQRFLRIGMKEKYKLVSYEYRPTPNGKLLFLNLVPLKPDFMGEFHSMPTTEWALQEYFKPIGNRKSAE